jgi:hypothetical protein
MPTLLPATGKPRLSTTELEGLPLPTVYCLVTACPVGIFLSESFPSLRVVSSSENHPVVESSLAKC